MTVPWLEVIGFFKFRTSYFKVAKPENVRMCESLWEMM